ncbi:MAG TPA: squalene/phytoene synthase family protein [Vicinamibacterales bacterium]|nr:squalene/phytoene synthase family protein [Vicinamibacterales bacterium]
MTRKTSFYYSFLVLPSAERRAITAVFDVCRAIDDAVDLETDPGQAAKALESWKAEVARVFESAHGRGASPETPQGRALEPFVKPFHLPREQFDALIEGVAMDAAPMRFQTFADLEPYCHRVASSVGLICAEIFQYKDQAVLTYARDLGVALQLTNILRDVAVDYRRDRMYLPLADLAVCGCSEDDIRREVERNGRGERSPKVRAALAQQAGRAREYFTRAVAVLPRDDASRFVAAEIMHGIYFELLKRIEAADYDVFSQLVRVPRPAQARLALRTWWTLRRGRIPQH